MATAQHQAESSSGQTSSFGAGGTTGAQHIFGLSAFGFLPPAEAVFSPGDQALWGAEAFRARKRLCASYGQWAWGEGFQLNTHPKQPTPI